MSELAPISSILFRSIDVGFKVVGTGSVGLRDYVVLFEGNGPGDPMFLQIKQEVASAYAKYLPGDVEESVADETQGRRAAEGQRAIQPMSDLLLGWTRIGAHDYLVRQLNDHKGSIDLQQLRGAGLKQLALVAGELLARGHARSGDACRIRGYCGSAEKTARALANFAVEYADQTEVDYRAFVAAIRKGPDQGRAPGSETRGEPEIALNSSSSMRMTRVTRVFPKPLQCLLLTGICTLPAALWGAPQEQNDIPKTFTPPAVAQDYVKREAMISIARRREAIHRDREVPRTAKNAPILLTRTPYNAAGPHGSLRPVRTCWLCCRRGTKSSSPPAISAIFQDIRRASTKSEGNYVMTRPVRGPLNKTTTDEATDAYDTIDWLVKNTPESNGRAWG